MGLDVHVPLARPPSLADLLARLDAAGVPVTPLMVDGALVAPPAAKAMSAFRDARLKTDAGTVTIRVVDGGLSIVVFGNADAALLAARDAIARALLSTG
jgi:hypothetical protein